MPTKSATSLFHNVTRALALALGLALTGMAAPVLGQAADEFQISLDQARQLAVEALQSGDPGLAVQVSKGLLQADPRDPLAHFIIASAYAQLNQPGPGRAAAGRAYRFADNDTARFRSAQLAAQMAYADGKPTLAQLWLRRTAIYAPTEEDKKLVARDYRILRRQNPWAFRLRTDLRPSNNVNNGADTALQIIDGIPVTGVLSGSAQALSGLIGALDLASTYRLRADAGSATSVGGRLYIQRVALSAAAQDLAPSARNSDFAATYAELSLRQDFAVGPTDKGGSGFAEAALGESWYGGERSYRFGRISAARSWRMSEGRSRVELRALAERRFKALYAANNARILSLGAKFSRGLENGDRLNLTMALRDTDAQLPNGTFTSASLRTSYTFAKPVGPAKLSAGLVLGYSDYPIYQSGLFLVPGGRQDKSVYGDLSLFFDRYDYAGFAPMLRMRSGRKVSNDSRFSTRELSLSLSIESKF